MNQYKKNILFIINPIAGVRSKKNIPALLEQQLDAQKIDYKIQYTECAGHAIELAKAAAAKGYDTVAAVGGDGTINEVARGLINTPCALGLIPMGSGNGLARHLNIPLELTKAIRLLNDAQIKAIDVGYLNGEMFLCTAGAGFDAEIAHEFDVAKGRGLITYAKCVLGKFSTYKEKYFTLTSGGNTISTNAFSITFANASQYGNGIFISPQSNIHDGKMEACILKPIPWWYMPTIWVKMRTKTIQSSRFYQSIEGEEFILERVKEDFVHLDGEPLKMGKKIVVSLAANALKVNIKNP